MAIQFIDLCSGIGGFHSGLMATGHYECVGHAEIDMTMYYAHAQESSKQEAISRYDEAFSAPGGGLYGNVIKLVKSG